jgi:hypothetical protein
MARLPDPADVIKIVMVHKPEERELGEGLYDLRFGTDPKEPHYFDIIGLEKELKRHLPGMQEDIIDRLYNFRQVYINKKTREVTI